MPSGPGGDKQRLALASRCNYPSHGPTIVAILCSKLFDRTVLDFPGQVDDDEIEHFLFSRWSPDGVLRSAAGPIPHHE